MSAGAYLQLAIVCIAAILAALGIAISARRFYRSATLARKEAHLALVRPRLLHLLAEDEPDLASLEDITGADANTLEDLVWQMLSKVRGSSRALLVKWLDERGAIEKARLRTYAFGPVGRAMAAERLGNAGVSSTERAVTRLLNDRNPEVRIVAARSLGKLGDGRSVPKLLNSLDGPKAIPHSLIFMAIIHIGPSAIEYLISGLSRTSERARAVCVELLGLHGAVQASKFIIATLQSDPSDRVRVHAAAALGRLGLPQGIEPLTRALAVGSPTPQRVAAARSLGLIGGANAIAALHTALADENEELGKTAGEALATLGHQGAEILSIAATSDHPVAARRAEEWLIRSEIGESSRRHRTHAGHHGGDS